MLTPNAIIESFVKTHPEVKRKEPQSYIEAMSLYEQTLHEDYGATTMDEITNTFYKDYYLSRAEKLKEEESKISWPYSISPYFAAEEVACLEGYYTEHIGYVPAHSDHGHYRSIQDRIEKLEKELKGTNDPEEIKRIHGDLEQLGWEPEKTSIYEGEGTQFDPKSYDRKLRILYTQLRGAENPEDIDYLKQKIISLGWNPEIDYSPYNRSLARKRYEAIQQEHYGKLMPLNIQWLVEQSDDSMAISEAKNSIKIKPIHIILVQGNSAFSGLITKITGGEFSHSAICLDNDFDRLYSFNLDNQLNLTGGFSLESIKNYPKENRLAIYTFFVKEEDWKKINDRIQLLLENIKKTNYSVVNILTMPFKHINVNMPKDMICSQFVDSLLKMTQIDITGKDSSKVTPKNLYDSVRNNVKAYKIFDGITKDFDFKKAQKYADKMTRRAKPFNESTCTFVEAATQDYIYPVITEARKLPVEVTPEGDLLLTNPMVDFDSEYAASHKLLMQYDKANNIEGLKYELARLYYMNYMLEKRLYSKKFFNDKEKNTKTRARVLNDFNKYIKVVLKAEPDFNFSEYYQDSIFYPHTVEVKHSTLLKMKDIVKYIL